MKAGANKFMGLRSEDWCEQVYGIGGSQAIQKLDLLKTIRTGITEDTAYSHITDPLRSLQISL